MVCLPLGVTGNGYASHRGKGAATVAIKAVWLSSFLDAFELLFCISQRHPYYKDTWKQFYRTASVWQRGTVTADKLTMCLWLI